ncbi:MAG: tetraacyldisaccharide 4'-kinase [Candidatus Cryptobacteroides sp.]
MIDRFLLFPYYLALKTRHFLFDHGLRKVGKGAIPTIGIGNVTVGGTGKTPHTELIVKELIENCGVDASSLAILSRGHKRSLKGFQVVEADGKAKEYGDEPLQMKRKFPEIIVAVDKDRMEGLEILSDPQPFLSTRKAAKKCKAKSIPTASIAVLDDCFQYRNLKPDLSIVLVDYNRPVTGDMLLPLGNLRDLPERIADADAIIVTKCPWELSPWEEDRWALSLGIERFNQNEACGVRSDSGRKQYLFFTRTGYDTAKAVFPEGDSRYLYSKMAVMFSGIADDTAFSEQLRLSYRLVGHLKFPDHHKFSRMDIRSVERQAAEFPTSLVITTEKDAQRVRDCGKISDELKKRLFYLPIKAEFLSESARQVFHSLVFSAARSATQKSPLLP